MKQIDKFTKISFTINNLDVFHPRNSILNALKATLYSFQGNFLDVGCGKMPYKSLILENKKIQKYIGLDIEAARDYDGVKADIVWTKDTKIPLEDNSIQSAMATEVLEHCPEPQRIIDEIFRVLEPNATFFLTVPFLWNLHEVPYDECRYTPFALERMLKNAGFLSIEIKAHGGWNAALGLMLACWCRRYWKNNILKFAFSLLFFPFIWFLFKIDNAPKNFGEGQMITGLYAIVKK
jgi:SAM-dependent methyltransferase